VKRVCNRSVTSETVPPALWKLNKKMPQIEEFVPCCARVSEADIKRYLEQGGDPNVYVSECYGHCHTLHMVGRKFGPFGVLIGIVITLFMPCITCFRHHILEITATDSANGPCCKQDTSATAAVRLLMENGADISMPAIREGPCAGEVAMEKSPDFMAKIKKAWSNEEAFNKFMAIRSKTGAPEVEVMTRTLALDGDILTQEEYEARLNIQKIWDARCKQAVAYLKIHQPSIGPDFESFIGSTLAAYGFEAFVKLLASKNGDASIPDTWRQQIGAGTELGAPPDWYQSLPTNVPPAKSTSDEPTTKSSDTEVLEIQRRMLAEQQKNRRLETAKTAVSVGWTVARMFTF
jgi:hypothetical protein